MNEPQPPIAARRAGEWIEVTFASGLPGPAGPAGADGTAGADGASVSVFKGGTQPTAEREGDLWLKPVTLDDGSPGVQLNVWDGDAWLSVSGASGADVDLTGVVFRDTSTTLARLTVSSPSWEAGNVYGDGNVVSQGGYFGELWYGALIARDGKATTQGYAMPTPTGEGYLRSDTDPDTGWYFAEPVIVSDTEPPAPTGGGAVWIDPTGDAPPDGFTNAAPLVYAEAPATTQTSGQPIGLSPDGMTFHQPDIVGGIPVVVNGKRYLIPIIEE